MAIAVTRPAVGRLVAALGLERCRRATITLGVDEVVMIKAEQYAEVNQLTQMAYELETNCYVVVTRDEYDTLKADAMLAARERDDAARNRDRLHGELGEVRQQLATALRERQEAKARVAELEHDGRVLLAERETARLNVVALRKRVAALEDERDGLRGDVKAAEKETERLGKKAVYLAADGWQHFPLYAAPPQPRGWLSEEERLLLLSLAESCDIRARLLESPGTMGIGLPKPADVRADAAILRNLLARTKPSGR